MHFSYVTADSNNCLFGMQEVFYRAHRLVLCGQVQGSKPAGTTSRAGIEGFQGMDKPAVVYLPEGRRAVDEVGLFLRTTLA